MDNYRLYSLGRYDNAQCDWLTANGKRCSNQAQYRLIGTHELERDGDIVDIVDVDDAVCPIHAGVIKAVVR